VQPPLTRRQREIVDFLRSYSAEHDISPTLEEIAQHFGVNKVTIFGHVAELERKGLLKRAAPRASRSLQLVPTTTAEIAPIQVLGVIAAGHPIEAIEVPEEFDLTELLPRGRDVYALRVKGSSMIDDGIHDGDLVLVERRENAVDGETVVAILPGEEATLKRFYREPDGSYRLQPANPELSALRVSSVEIRGVVLGVIRTIR
jgi:repressor LexA